MSKIPKVMRYYLGWNPKDAINFFWKMHVLQLVKLGMNILSLSKLVLSWTYYPPYKTIWSCDPILNTTSAKCCGGYIWELFFAKLLTCFAEFRTATHTQSRQPPCLILLIYGPNTHENGDNCKIYSGATTIGQQAALNEQTSNPKDRKVDHIRSFL
jgi:hypothetical protein